jgi:cell fate (sporulation/competence/biofilm development) regulator YlbF (YheA/YmcA/DUF963 family)
MDDVTDLLERAKALGESLARHPRVVSFAAARRALHDSREARDLLVQYTQHAERLHELEAGQKPIEVADKHKLAEIETRMAGNDVLKQYMRVQADYIELMNQISRAMEEPAVRALQEKPS